MRARYVFVESLMEIDKLDAAQSALSYLTDMLRLCRSDNLGVRYEIPALMLRLGKDQDCYDFVLWWRKTGQEEHYDWGDMSLPYLDKKNENIFGSSDIAHFTGEWITLSHTVAVSLIKIRLMLDLIALQKSSEIAEKLPTELFNNVRFHMVGSVIAERDSVMSSLDQTRLILDLMDQISTLFSSVKANNKHFWPALVDHRSHLTSKPAYHSSGTIEEAQLVLQYSYKAWYETPGAVDLIRGILKASP